MTRPATRSLSRAGAVNAVAFHPTEPIIASAGSDKRVILGELA